MDRRRLILPALLLAAFAINLDTTIVNVALPTLVRQLHAVPLTKRVRNATCDHRRIGCRLRPMD